MNELLTQPISLKWRKGIPETPGFYMLAEVGEDGESLSKHIPARIHANGEVTFVTLNQLCTSSTVGKGVLQSRRIAYLGPIPSSLGNDD